MILRPYQSKLIDDVRKSIAAGHKRVIMQSHVGSGKTIMATDIIQSAIDKKKRVLFLAPRRQLIYQTVETLSDHGINCGVIMAGERRYHAPLVQVASFDTITSRVALGIMDLPEADFVIVDEAHMCVTPARIKVLEHYKLCIGLTATPALANGKGLGFFYKDIVESLSMAEMVEQGHLVPMRYFAGSAPDLSGVSLNKDGDYVEKQLAAVNDTPSLIGEIYANWKRIASDRTTLVFAVNRSHARHIHDEFKSHGISTAYIDGETPPEEREAIRKDVESGAVQVVINIGVMVAGVNWPRISCVVIARQMRNIATWIQCIGRGSRLYHGKEDCLVIYHGDNFDELGRIDDPIEWTLDDKTTIRERKERAQKEAKAPKEIKCQCGAIFKSSRICPACGHEMIPKGEEIPVHQADLKELKGGKKIKPAEKLNWYAQFLYVSRKKGYADGWAAHAFYGKFKEWPHRKSGVQPIPPTPEVLGYMQHLAIKQARSSAA
ncbi:MAG: DEAD/DEAH box helicase [Methylobacter sp.]